VTQTLLALAIAEWDLVEGYCVSQGIDWAELRPQEFCSLVFFFWMKEADNEQREAFRREIEKPPVGVNPTKGMWSDEETFKQFQATMGSMGR